MRVSVLLFCVAGLILSLLIVRFGVASRTREQQNVSTLPASAAVVGVQLGKNRAARPVLEQPTPAVLPDTASLLQQIQDGLNSTTPGDQAAVFTNQFLALIRSDPWAAARFAESAEDGTWHTELMHILAQNWAQLNFPDAEKWVSQITNSDERDTMLSGICFQVAQTDPRLAIQALEKQGLNDDRREIMLENLAHQWAAQDLPQAVNWAGNYPPGETRDNLFMQIASAESLTSPTEAANMVASQIYPGPIQDEAAISVLQQWGLQSLTDATAWADQFPSGDISNRAKKELARIANQATTGTP